MGVGGHGSACTLWMLPPVCSRAGIQVAGRPRLSPPRLSRQFSGLCRLRIAQHLSAPQHISYTRLLAMQNAGPNVMRFHSCVTCTISACPRLRTAINQVKTNIWRRHSEGDNESTGVRLPHFEGSPLAKRTAASSCAKLKLRSNPPEMGTFPIPQLSGTCNRLS